MGINVARAGGPVVYTDRNHVRVTIGQITNRTVRSAQGMSSPRLFCNRYYLPLTDGTPE